MKKYKDYKNYSGQYYKRWTITAIECYKSGCNCSKCELINGLESITRYTCRMKQAVMELVRRVGAPDLGGDDYGSEYTYDERDTEIY